MPILLLIFLLVLGLLSSIIIYKRGLVNVIVPRAKGELDGEYYHKYIEERSEFYEMIPWDGVIESKSKKYLKIILSLLIGCITYSVIFNLLLNPILNFSAPLTEFISQLVTIFLGILFFTLILIYATILIFTFQKPNYRNMIRDLRYPQQCRNMTLEEFETYSSGAFKDSIVVKKKSSLPEELVNLFRKRSDKLILMISFIIFCLLSIYSLVMDFITFQGVMFSLILLPLVSVVTRIEGQFFYLFTINQVYKVRNWDPIEGKQIVTKSFPRSVPQWLTRGLALVAILSIPISLLGGVMSGVDFIQGNFGVGDEGILFTVTKSLFTAEIYSVFFIILSLGPLLTLITKPFEFVQIFLNQGIYELISSNWEQQYFNTNLNKYYSQFRFPQRLPGFLTGIFLSSTSILVLLGFNLFVSTSVMNTDLINSLREALSLLAVISAFIIFLTLLDLTRNLTEERTFWLFAREGRRNNIDLINWSLYGMELIVNMRSLDKYLTRNPPNWGLGLYLQVIGTRKPLSEKIDLLHEILDNQMVLPPELTYYSWERLAQFYFEQENFEKAYSATKEMLNFHPKYAAGWNDLGIILYQLEKPDEAEKAWLKALKLDPRLANSMFNLGLLHFNRNELDTAENYWIRATKTDPNYQNAWYNLTCLYVKQENEVEALKSLEKVLKIDCSVISFLKTDDSLNSLKSTKGFQQLIDKYSFPR